MWPCWKEVSEHMHREVGRFVGDFVQKEINSQLFLHENKFSIEFVHCSGRACAHSFTIWLNFRTFSIFFGGAHWKISFDEGKWTDTREIRHRRDLGIVAVVYFRNWKSEFSCCSLRDRQLFLERAHTEHFPHTHIHIHRNGHFAIISFLHIFEIDGDSQHHWNSLWSTNSR